LSYFKAALRFELPETLPVESKEIPSFKNRFEHLDLEINFMVRKYADFKELPEVPKGHEDSFKKFKEYVKEFEVYGGQVIASPHSTEILDHPHKWTWEIWPKQTILKWNPELFAGSPSNESFDPPNIHLGYILLSYIEFHIRALSDLALRPSVHKALWTGFEKMWKNRSDFEGGLRELYLEDDRSLKETIDLDGKCLFFSAQYGYGKIIPDRSLKPLPKRRIEYLHHALGASPTTSYWDLFYTAIKAADESEIALHGGSHWIRRARDCISSLQTALEVVYQKTQSPAPQKNYSFGHVLSKIPEPPLRIGLHELYLTRNLVLHQGVNEFKRHIDNENRQDRLTRGGDRPLKTEDLLRFADNAFDGIRWFENNPNSALFQ